MREPRAYLEDVLGSIEKIRSFTEGIADAMAYSANALVKSATERELTIIGEALITLSKTREDLTGRIPYFKELRGFRNILVHNYTAVDEEIVWRVVTGFLDGLADAVTDLLKESP